MGQQFANMTMIAVVSVLNVFWKEIAAAKAVGNHLRVVEIFARVRRVLFYWTAAVACLLAVYNREIITVTLGRHYEQGALCLALMLLYPVHQSLGHIQGTFLLATGETRIYTYVGIGTMLASLPVTFFALAPESGVVPGLGLGAVGLAGKMLLLQLVGTTIQFELLTRPYHVQRDYAYQAAAIVGMIGFAAACKLLITPAIRLGGAPGAVLSLIPGSVLYATGAFLFIWKFGRLAGIDPARVISVGRDYLKMITARRERAL